MEVVTTPAALSAWSREQRTASRRIALVPTMGALHDGHLALVSCAHTHANTVAVSIFVNPLQFERGDDFDTYPRPIDDDLARCQALGVDLVYAPVASTMYPPQFDTTVQPGRLADVLEGARRPGHFLGVATVVAKLLNAARPDVAVFGQKDFQQLAVIRRMVADLDMPIDIIGMPTARDADGVAMSSRNRRLTPAQRSAAVCVPNMLKAVRAACAGGLVDANELLRIARAVVDTEPLARFEHLEFVHPHTLLPVEQVEAGTVAVTAVWFDDVRLIDNVTVG
ncbi:MAG: pantoate--beta-alanine ligase [Actinomycetota bacterium]